MIKYRSARKKTIIVLLLQLSVLATAKTYYVAPYGNDGNPGTITQPWGTWMKAFNIPNAGDTVYFRGGVYHTNPNGEDAYGYWTTDKYGTEENPICYFAYPGEEPILDCINNDPSTNDGINRALRFWRGGFMHFKGLTVRNVLQVDTLNICMALEFYTIKNSIIENFTIYNVGGVAFQNSECDSLFYINCDGYNLCDSISHNPGNFGSAFGVYNERDTTKYMSFYGCRAWNCGDQGFAYNDDGYVKTESCWSFNNGMLDGGGYGYKIGYKQYYDVAFNQRDMINCIAANNRVNGIESNDRDIYTVNTRIYNCSVYHNGWGVTKTDYDVLKWGIYFFGTVSSDEHDFLWRKVRNTIAYDDFLGPIRTNVYSIYDDSYNSWNTEPGATVTDADFLSLDVSELLKPRKADGSLPDVNFMKLAPGSDLIDKGKDVGLDFSGSAPDLGWAETGGIPSTPSIPTYISSVIENASPSRLEMTYNLSLANIVPAISSFAVTVNSVNRPVSSVAISGIKVLLTLASPVAYGDVVKVAYTKPAANPLQTPSGGLAPSISTQNVTNNVAIIINQSPIVSISSPTKSNSYIDPATITIETLVSDPDGTIARVEFYQGSAKLGELTSAPYSFVWKSVPAGQYTITAAATDNNNSRTLSAPVTVVVEKSSTAINQMPSVNIIYRSEKKPKKHDNITITVEATDPDGSITKVELKSGTVTVGEIFTPPYTFTLHDADTGLYVLTAIATDNLGATTISPTLELRVTDFYDAGASLMNLYPNPTDGWFRIELLEEFSDQDKRISIVDLSGNAVYSDVLTGAESTMDVDITQLLPGTYVLIMSDDLVIVATRKLIRR